jgi:hypothetical protein
MAGTVTREGPVAEVAALLLLRLGVSAAWILLAGAALGARLGILDR